MSVLEKFLAEAESWVGTPYFTEGCTRGVKGGTNCASWFVDVMRTAIPNSESIEYARNITHQQYYKKNIDVMPEVMDHVAFQVEWDNKWEDLKPGDVLFPRIRRVAAIPSIYLGDGKFVYCDISQKVVVKEPLLGNFTDRIMYVYRFHAIAEEG